MKGLAVSFAILCLALASGAAATEEKKINTKNYEFDGKDIIHSANNVIKDELLYAVCENEDVDKKCKIYLESTDPNESTVRSCDVNLSYKKPYWHSLELQNTGYKKVIFIVRDGQKAKFIIVNMSDCHVKEAAIELAEMQKPKFPHSPKVAIMPHENSFDVIISNRKLCQSPMCKATLDYDGKVVKEASGFGMKDLVDDNFYLEMDKDRLFKLYNDTLSKVYLMRNGELDETPLFVSDQDTIATATNEKKISFCKYTGNLVTCKQYDAEGKNKIFEAEATMGDLQIIPRNFDMLNLEKGMLAVMNVVEKKQENLDRKVMALHFDEQGKQAKVIDVGLEINEDGAYYLNLYKNKKGEPCVLGIFIYYNTKESTINSVKFSRSTKCFTNDELV